MGVAHVLGFAILSGLKSIPTMRWVPRGVAPSPSRLSDVTPPFPMVQG
ncbi:MAG: hypothetical protein ACI84R_000211 [Candidatus Azotimanducaceae bacterium]|jgi:hypothetical protein